MTSALPFVPNEPEQRISIALDGAQYVMRARWNTRDDADVGAWYLDVWEIDGTTPILLGIKLVLGVFLGQGSGHPLFRAGLFLVDDSGTGEEPRLGDLGGRVNLLHLTMADAVVLASNP